MMSSSTAVMMSTNLLFILCLVAHLLISVLLSCHSLHLSTDLMAHLTTLLVTINICGIQSEVKLSLLKSFINRHRFDVVMLQEVSVPSFNFFGYNEIVNLGPDRRGTALLYKENLPLTHPVCLPCGRGIGVRFGHCTLVNVYAPSGNQSRQERALFFSADIVPLFVHAIDHVILAGDFNAVLRKEDTLGCATICGPLRGVVDGYHLRDPVVECGLPLEFTYRTANSASRLDRFYVSDRDLAGFKSLHNYPVVFTDHLAVACHINLGVSYAPRGPSYWKLDTTVLQDPSFLPNFQQFWVETVSHQRRFPSKADWWDNYAKRKIQVFCRLFTKSKYREENALADFYEKCLAELYALPPFADNMLGIRELKARLTLLRQRKLHALSVRSKCDTTQVGEMVSMYHAVSRHQRARSRAVHSLRTAGGEQLVTNRDILAHAKDYFQSLLAHPMGPSCAPLFLEEVPRLICEEEAADLAADLTAEELQWAVSVCPQRKSPGPDGLPAEFYKCVWGVIAEDMLTVFAEVLSRGRLCASQGQGVIVLVPKVPSAAQLSQYRPLTMLNCDYKILARALNKRMLSVLPRVLHPSQVGPGSARDITASLCDIRDVISHHETTGEPAALVSLDLAGAFNNVHHEYLFQLLRKLGFGAKFVGWLRAYIVGAPRVWRSTDFYPRALPLASLCVREGRRA